LAGSQEFGVVREDRTGDSRKGDKLESHHHKATGRFFQSPNARAAHGCRFVERRLVAVCEREKREVMEIALYENQYAQEMLRAGKVEEYMHYLKVSQYRLKCGMEGKEIETVIKRAEEAAGE